jgi:hypothetical protein
MCDIVSMRKYVFGEDAQMKSKRGSDTKYVKDLKVLLRKQKRWITRIKRAMTAISKIERQIKRLDA